MSRNSVFFIVFTLYLGITGVSASWVNGFWHDSDPAGVPVVKGATTMQPTASPAEAALSEYPEFDVNRAGTIRATQFVLYHQESGKVLYQSEKLDPVAIASTTKAMTAHVITQIGKMDDVYAISKEAAALEGSQMGALAGQRFTVEHLLYASMLVSGNDAAQALAEYGGGLLLKDTDASVEAKTARFVEEMNATARRLGLKDTQYKDPVGLDDLGRSTALDLAKLAGSLNQDPILSRMIGTATITVTDQSGRAGFDLKNSNRLIAEYDYPGSLGGKTGFTPDAGHCLISSAKRDGHTLTAVILKTSDEKNEASAVEARKLLDLGFSLTSWR